MAHARSTSVALGRSSARAPTRAAPMGRIALPDVGDDRRVGRRADRAVRDRVLELVDRARVVPDVGGGRGDGPTERTVGQRERASRPARERRHRKSLHVAGRGCGSGSHAVRSGSADGSVALTACPTVLPFRHPRVIDYIETARGSHCPRRRVVGDCPGRRSWSSTWCARASRSWPGSRATAAGR